MYESMINQFSTNEYAIEKKITTYVIDAKSNYVSIDREARRAIFSSTDLHWSAASASTRIKTLRFILTALEQLKPTLKNSYRSVSSVLISSDQWVLPASTAYDIDIICGAASQHRI